MQKKIDNILEFLEQILNCKYRICNRYFALIRERVIVRLLPKS